MNKYLFKQLFTDSRCFSFSRTCVHSDDFLKTAKAKMVHNFVRRYDQEKSIASEDRLVQNFYSQHKQFYNFESLEEIVVSFLSNVRNRFVPSAEEVFKCGYSHRKRSIFAC